MKRLPEGVKVKRAELPRGQHFVKASYAVFLDGKAIGHVDKVVQPTGNQATPKRRVVTDICWAWRSPGVKEDPCGYDTRHDAIGWLLKAVDVPRETSTEE